jgi:universal stress protein E
MQPFRNLLVNVDLSNADEQAAANQQAVRSALWLTRESSAAVTFFSRLPNDNPEDGPASRILSALVGQARQNGLTAKARTAVGNPEAELLRQVHRENHDLVLIGATRQKSLTSELFGGATSRLLDECPCPVWLAVEGAPPAPRNILLADDVESSDEVLKVGLSLPRTVRSVVHVLNVVDYPLDHHWTSGDLDELTARYHTQVSETAEQALRARLAPLGPLPEDLRLHVVGRTGIPDVEILHFIREHSIDLVVLGRTNRNRFLAVLLGHTADRLLPEVPCSLLIVKKE